MRLVPHVEYNMWRVPCEQKGNLMRKIILALAISLYLASTFVLGASAHTSRINVKPISRLQIQPNVGCFPGNAQWTWTDTNHNPPLQAWIGQLENDSTGYHYNYHIQQLCGGDYHNYHIYYYKGDSSNYVWNVYDSTKNTKRTYKYPRGCGCGGGFPEIAADVTAPQFASDAAKDAGDQGLYNASVSTLTQVFFTLGSKSGDK